MIITLSKKEIIVPFYDYKENEYERMQMTISLLREYGQIRPLIVRKVENGYEIIKGMNLFSCMLEVGIETFMCFHLGEIGDTEALNIRLLLEESANDTNSLRLAVLIDQHKQVIGTQRLLEILKISKVDILNYLALADFKWNRTENKYVQKSIFDGEEN